MPPPPSAGEETKIYHAPIRGGHWCKVAESALPTTPETELRWPEYGVGIEVPDDIWSRLEDATPSEVSKTESLIKRMGGKSQLREWLVSVFPYDVSTYVEPFGGSFKVLLWKSRRAKIEVINDVDADMVHFFRCAAEHPKELCRYINSLPLHEALVYGCREQLNRGEVLTPLKHAAAWYLSHACSFNANISGHNFAVSPHVSLDHRLTERDVRAVAARLEGVVICSTDYVRLVDKMNKEIPPVGKSRYGGGFFYFDPPYHETRGYATHQGASLFGDEDQKRLADLCYEIHLKGNRFVMTNSSTDFIKSLYASYKGATGEPAFHFVERNVYYSINGNAEERGEETEIVVSNFPLITRGPQGTLF